MRGRALPPQLRCRGCDSAWRLRRAQQALGLRPQRLLLTGGKVAGRPVSFVRSCVLWMVPVAVHTAGWAALQVLFCRASDPGHKVTPCKPAPQWPHLQLADCSQHACLSAGSPDEASPPAAAGVTDHQIAEISPDSQQPGGTGAAWQAGDASGAGARSWQATFLGK